MHRQIEDRRRGKVNPRPTAPSTLAVFRAPRKNERHRATLETKEVVAESQGYGDFEYWFDDWDIDDLSEYTILEPSLLSAHLGDFL